MKRFFRYIGFAALACLLAPSCNSLEQEPTNKFTDKAFWTSPDRARMVLNMAYNQMYSHGKIWQDECLTDNMVEFRGNNDSKTIRTGLATSTTGMFRGEWEWCFQGIKTTNVFMDFVDIVPGFDTAEKDRMKAEVRFIRALLYFRLSNFYGDIPFFLGDITLEQSRKLTRTSRADVLIDLHKELDEIIPELPRKEDLTTAENGRITRAAAMVLKARMYLYEGTEEDMKKVRDICADLIEKQGEYGKYSLFNDNSQQYGQSYSAYENLFTSKFEYNDEVILDYVAIEITKEWQMWNLVPQSLEGTQVCSRAPTKSLADAYLRTNGAIWAEGDAAYTGRDPRFAASIVYNGATWKDTRKSGKDLVGTTKTINTIGDATDDGHKKGNASATGYYVRKYFDPTHRSDYRMNNNIIMMRWAEVLLMYAEALESLGELDQSKWNITIRPIRERAGLSGDALNFDFNHGEDMDKVIARERRVELAFEGLRYFDLMRMGEVERNNILNGMVYGAKDGSGYIQVVSYYYTSRDKLWSVPQVEMELAPGLRPNNTGY